MKIGFIGAGNIAESIISGLIKSKSIKSTDICVSNYNSEKSDRLVKNYLVQSMSNDDIIDYVDIIVLALKPYMICDFLSNNLNKFKEEKVVVSVASGITLKEMFNHSNNFIKLVRAMPNTSCSINSGIFATSFEDNATSDLKKTIRNLFSPLGTYIEVQESKMNGISVLAGCAPAFIYEIINGLSDGGVRMGLSRSESLELAASVVSGAGQMVMSSNIHPSLLKEQVTSPAGTTIEGIYSLEKAGLRGIIMEALQASFNKTNNK